MDHSLKEASVQDKGDRRCACRNVPLLEGATKPRILGIYKTQHSNLSFTLRLESIASNSQDCLPMVHLGGLGGWCCGDVGWG